MDTLIIHPKSVEQANLFEQLAKALDVPFERESEGENESTYNREFVNKILNGSKEISEGKGTQIGIEDLWK